MAATTIRLSVDLPYLFLLPDGVYDVAVSKDSKPGRDFKSGIGIEQIAPEGGGSHAGTTRSRAYFDFEDNKPGDEAERQKTAEKKQRIFLDHLNRLIRWYRVLTQDPSFVELTRYGISPVRFAVLATQEPWIEDIHHAPGPPGAVSGPVSVRQLEDAIRRGLIEQQEPEVADLFLLDAEEARHTGRFREAVLFCWSTIDATFNRIYDQLVDRKLSDEWGQGRDFFKDNDFGLRNKMSAAMYLIAGRSLFREPDKLWEKLTSSYTKRNKIIHAGQLADEADAEQTIQVARQVVEVMRSILRDSEGAASAAGSPEVQAPPPRTST
ncbi:hypothetical protein [Chondromyces apiculatus]|uniref:Apea-like HEPN domain-containing protein n=1 Tax=Chondromyces apiculatus DSM 436 TaxID=1192034 RepID=A0A017TCS2_9BACT|nr:hypothetical protein [Chondromyces apiculatus]EYF06727.1 Hypothetical protein CAP_1424 [Chondromyces apiculatus DSM 436]